MTQNTRDRRTLRRMENVTHERGRWTVDQEQRIRDAADELSASTRAVFVRQFDRMSIPGTTQRMRMRYACRSTIGHLLRDLQAQAGR